MSETGRELDYYRLFLDQIEKVRAVHRDTRRFYTTLNITGATTLVGLQVRAGADGALISTLGCVVLALLCVVWFAATSHYDRAIQHKAKVIATLERSLGVDFFTAENRALTGGELPPRLVWERTAAGVLALAYLGLAVAIQSGDSFRVFRAVTAPFHP
jgi:hypothetical protein